MRFKLGKGIAPPGLFSWKRCVDVGASRRELLGLYRSLFSLISQADYVAEFNEVEYVAGRISALERNACNDPVSNTPLELAEEFYIAGALNEELDRILGSEVLDLIERIMSTANVAFDYERER